MTEIKPIETRYAGCRFRSRLEARWAVFFDQLGIKWQYETEGYEMSTGDRYLPDFYLPDFDQWVEVKGELSHSDFRRLLVAAPELPTKRPDQIHTGVLILGPTPTPGQPYGHARVGATGGKVAVQSVFFTRRSTLYPLGPVVLWDLAATLRLSEQETGWIRKSFTEASSTDDLALVPLVDAAYRAARSARFEHGESGSPVQPSAPAKRGRKIPDNPRIGYLRGTLVRVEETYDLSTVDGRVAALREVAPVIAACKDDTQRDEWIGIAADRLGLAAQIDAVAQAVANHRRK